MKKIFGLVATILVLLMSCSNMIDDGDTSGFLATELVMTNVYNAVYKQFDYDGWLVANDKAMTYDPSVQILAKAKEYIFVNISERPENIDIQANVYVYSGPTFSANGYTAEMNCCVIAKTSLGIVVFGAKFYAIGNQLFDDANARYCFQNGQCVSDYNTAVILRDSSNYRDPMKEYVASHCWINGVRQY